MNVEGMVLKTKEDCKKILDMMNSAFDKKIDTLHEWLVVACIISDVLKIERKNIDDNMVKAFIDEFNGNLKKVK